MKRKMTAMTIAMAVLMIIATLVTAEFQPRPFDIGDYSQANIEEAEKQFASSQTNEDLVLLCKALSWRIEIAGEAEAGEKLNHYGQLLLDRAKEESVDLEEVDDPEVMLAVLKVIRETGAK